MSNDNDRRRRREDEYERVRGSNKDRNRDDTSRDNYHNDERQHRPRDDVVVGSGRGHGLGYYDERGRGTQCANEPMSWERNNRGRTDDVNFVRPREGSNNDGAIIIGMGRGRGRGSNINLPAWMTTNNGEGDAVVGPSSSVVGMDVGDGPIGSVGRGRGRGRGGGSILNNDSGGGGGVSRPKAIVEDKALEKLLDRARQTQQEQTKLQEGGNINARTTMISSSSNVVTSARDRNAMTSVEAKKNDERIEAEKETARKAEEEERERQERKRKEEEFEEEERCKLLALVGDDDEMFEFETVEAQEERIACERREERRKRLKAIVEQNDSSRHAAVNDHAIENVVDRPRNALGIMQSELQDAVIVAKSQADVDATITAMDRVDEANDSSESFDMFDADNVTPVLITTNDGVSRGNWASANNAQECDDAEGYYKTTIGEVITLPKERRDDDDNGEDDKLHRMTRFRVLGIIGKGVFSSVIKCIEEKVDNSNAGEGRVVAMKIIRNNEIMAKAAAKEMRILRILCHQSTKTTGNKMKQSTKDGNTEEEEEDVEERERRERENHNIVRLFNVDSELSSTATDWYLSSSAYAAPPPEFRSHCVFLFEFMPYNLREVLSKFGKHVGINLTAVRSYARQLLCALAHLERHRVVHADLKPDNILVSANFSTVKLADFGSAFFETDFDNDPTPYLVSRFYRPPEVILGLEYDRMVDLWSASVSLAELFTGSVLFPGKTNNDMLVRFMDCLGPLSHKMAKRHALSYTRMGLQPHFEVGVTGGTYQLRKQNVDRVTGEPVCNLVNVLSAKPECRLAQVLLRASKGGGSAERVEVLKLADFLNRCLSLDPTRRLSVREALRHDFFMKKKKKIDTT